MFSKFRGAKKPPQKSRGFFETALRAVLVD